jgi:hypothetical protein
MLKTVLCSALLLALVASSLADGPDPDQSYVYMLNGGKGLATCPAGDGLPYDYILVTLLRDDLTPVEGVPWSDFHFTISGVGSGHVSIAHYDPETNPTGDIRFQALGDGAVPYGSLTVTVRVDTLALNDSDTLWCNTLDYDGNGGVDAADLAMLATDYGTTNERSDFDWSGEVNPVDFVHFAWHYGHRSDRGAVK